MMLAIACGIALAQLDGECIVCYRGWDQITGAHLRSCLSANHIGIAVEGLMHGNGVVIADCPEQKVSRLLEKLAPADQFSIYISGVRKFSNPDLKEWPKSSVSKLRGRFPTIPLARALIAEGVLYSKSTSVSYRRRRYLGHDTQWHTGFELAMHDTGGWTVFQLMRNGSGYTIARTLPNRGEPIPVPVNRSMGHTSK
jgi:hypothetical protein